MGNSKNCFTVGGGTNCDEILDQNSIIVNMTAIIGVIMPT